jgi:hypothetical protein
LLTFLVTWLPANKARAADQKKTARIAAGRIADWLPDQGSNLGPAD